MCRGARVATLFVTFPFHADARADHACCYSCNLNCPVTSSRSLFFFLFPFLSSYFLLSLFAFVIPRFSYSRLILPCFLFPPNPLFYMSPVQPSSFFSLSLERNALQAKIALFLYNAHARRSYCNLVRSRFRVIGAKKYFHGCGTPNDARETPRGNLPGRKSRAAINSPLKRNRSSTFYFLLCLC